MNVCAPLVSLQLKEARRVAGLLGLERQTTVSHHVGVGTQAFILRESSNAEPLLQPPK